MYLQLTYNWLKILKYSEGFRNHQLKFKDTQFFQTEMSIKIVQWIQIHNYIQSPKVKQIFLDIWFNY